MKNLIFLLCFKVASLGASDFWTNIKEFATSFQGKPVAKSGFSLIENHVYQHRNL